MTKKELRERILTLLRNQKEEERLNKSLLIGDKLVKMQEFKDAKTILFYASFDGEVETFEMIKKAKQLGKKIGLPRVDKAKNVFIPFLVDNLDDLKQGAYGIKEPVNKEELSLPSIDMVVVPGVAFDVNNNRLGRGGGYYDRFLTTLSSDIPSVGLAFDFQIVDSLPQVEEHDVVMSSVLA